jgi:hypothetical protein
VTAGTDSHPNDPHVATPGTVRQVTPPPAARALSTLCHVDYQDAFLAGTGPAQDRTGGAMGPGDPRRRSGEHAKRALEGVVCARPAARFNSV